MRSSSAARPTWSSARRAWFAGRAARPCGTDCVSPSPP
jgi:hypothetical protein